MLTDREQNLIADVRQYEKSLEWDETPQEIVIRGIVEEEFGYDFQYLAETAAREGGFLSDILEQWIREDTIARLEPMGLQE
jgi:hypothetical protein